VREPRGQSRGQSERVEDRVRESRGEVDRFIEKADSKFLLFGGEGDGRDSREEARLVDKENNYCDVFLGLRAEGGGRPIRW
jgi:hypothetical protein